MGTTMMKHNYRRSKVHPQMFALWIAMGSIVMMFGGFTSAYIVKKAAGNWLEFELPSIFYVSTFVVLLSSVCLHYSYKSFIAERESTYKIFLVVGLLLGVSFVVLQYYGWNELFAIGVDLKSSISGAFIYLITGIHALHILGGIAALTVAIIHAYSLPFKCTEKRKHRFEMTLYYWHFVDILWVYLFGFLLLYR